MKSKKGFALCILLLLVTVACLHKSNNAPVTSWEKVSAYNAALADTNQTVQQGVVVLVTNQVLSPAQAKPIMEWCGSAASINSQIASIIGKGSVVSAADYSTVQALTQQLSDSAKLLIASGALGIKNPKSQQSVSADVDSIVSLAGTILGILQSMQAPVAFIPDGPIQYSQLLPDKAGSGKLMPFYVTESVASPPLITCDSKVGDKPNASGCKIADGRNLDDVVNMMIQMQRDNTSMFENQQDEIEGIIDLMGRMQDGLGVHSTQATYRKESAI